ncbi:MAG TPA: hypothetical protein VD794_10155 [Flavisolibacter sp.]|nr:hypothetical protein [Flavisolibacter sp.]
MKSTLYILLFGIVLLSNSCKKDNEEDITNDLARRIHGKWQINSIMIKENLSGTERNVTHHGGASDYFDFKPNGKVYTSMQGQSDDYDYFVNENENKINIDGDNATILELSEHTFIFSDRDLTATIGYTEITYSLKR